MILQSVSVPYCRSVGVKCPAGGAVTLESASLSAASPACSGGDATKKISWYVCRV